MARPGEIALNGQVYTLASDSQLPKGKRAYVRRNKTTQPSDPGQIKTMRWKISGPMGQSHEREDGFLGVEYCINLEHQYDNLLTAVATRNTLTLSSKDPIAGSAAKLGAFAFGAAAFGGGTGLNTPGNITHIDEDRGYIFCGRGTLSTQVDITGTPAVVQTRSFDARIRGAAQWFGRGYYGLGGAVAVRRRTTVGAGGSQYEPVSSGGVAVHAKELGVGNDRLWMVHGDPSGVDENKVRYTLDDFTSISNAFQVGDPKVPATGIGTLGPYTIVGSESGAFTFTDEGRPVRLLDALRGHRDSENGLHVVSQWGWFYIATDLGLFAGDGGVVVNPVGPESLRKFEGPVQGSIRALWPWRDSLFAGVYNADDTQTHIVRGVFGPQTAATGLPEWYAFRRVSGVADCMFSTNLRTNPTMLVGEGASTLSWYTMGRRGRDIADGNYSFSVDGGQWFGSRSQRTPNMHKNVRYGMFITEQCSATKTWTLAVSADGGSYIDIGSAVTSNGHQTVRPVSASVPLTTVNGHSFKPRLTQVNDSTSTPPQVRGYLDIVYDERPDQVEEVTYMLALGRRHEDDEMSDLLALADHSQASPVTHQRPGETSDVYGFVTSVEENDLAGNGVQGVTVSLQLWDVS